MSNKGNKKSGKFLTFLILTICRGVVYGDNNSLSWGEYHHRRPRAVLAKQRGKDLLFIRHPMIGVDRLRSNHVRRRRGEVPSSLPRRQVDLKVLRGRGLVARDANYVTEASSDPYCVVLVDDEELGRTNVINGSLDPVWSTRNSFEAVDVSPSSVVTVRLFDKDVMSEDDPMGEIRVVIGDWIATRDRRSPASPNRWFQVVPTAGCPCSGTLELRILLDSEKVRPHAECGDNDPRRVFREGCSKPKSMRRLSAHSVDLAVDVEEQWLFTNFVWGHPERAVVDHIARATTPVLLHIYDVGHSSWIAGLNRTTGAFGGVFHGARRSWCQAS